MKINDHDDDNDDDDQDHDHDHDANDYHANRNVFKLKTQKRSAEGAGMEAERRSSGFSLS